VVSKKPLFICLCAIWNHQNSWVENIMQCFLNQDYEGDAELYLIDDRPGYADFGREVLLRQGSRTIYHLTYPKRFDLLMAKYTAGLGKAAADLLLTTPYVSVWDDDDIYLEHFMSDHAETLKDHPWSYPSHVFSAYGGTFQKEPTQGRFWASSAYRLDALDAIGGYGENHLPWFDQDFLARMRKQHGEEIHGPSRCGYVYNWSHSGDNHTSFYMGDANGSWFTNTPPSPIPTSPLVPRHNPKHLEVMAMYRVFTGGQ
jgi:hypothetical protein